ncbi:MAG: FAD:protein FMN transferase, partial [Acidimicrobiia bacterium]
MRHGEFRAMGTRVEAWTADQAGFEATVEWFDEVEEVCSRFRPNSELSSVNGDSRHRVPVSTLLHEVLTHAREMRSLTGGLVDAGLGAAVIAWGYDRTFDEVAGLSEPPPFVPHEIGWDLEPGHLVREPGTMIDLGGVGKGWACDVAVDSGLALVVSAGGDIRSAHPETVVPIFDPWGEHAAEVALGSGALATSSTANRRWKVGDAEAHHLIDPRTRRPADSPILTATVIASTAAAAEAGAKTVLLLGEDGLSWADAQDWIRAALIVWHDGSVFATSGMELAA